MVEDCVIKFLLAILFGGIIGAEREVSHKPAGLRTMILITLGCTLFAIISLFPFNIYGAGNTLARIDPGRIAANILTGLGFIGGGVILYTKGSVTGITTASMIWCAGALGMTIGFGYYLLALIFTITIFLVAFVIGHIEKRYTKTKVN